MYLCLCLYLCPRDTWVSGPAGQTTICRTLFQSDDMFRSVIRVFDADCKKDTYINIFIYLPFYTYIYKKRNN